MLIDDSAFPAPAHQAFSLIPLGSSCRRSDGHIITRGGDSVTHWDQNANGIAAIGDDEQVQPVGATLVVSAP